MNLKSSFFIFLALIFCGSKGYAQTLQEIEAELAALQYKIGDAPTDQERVEANETFRKTLIKAFGEEGVYDYPFSSLLKIGMLPSGDGAFKLFTWNLPKTDGTYTYCAFLVFPDGKDYTELIDSEDLTMEDESKTFTDKNWYGALYYHIQPVKEKGDTYYTLLGWDGNNKLSNMKIIDALEIDKRGKVEFGKPVFTTENGIRNRQIFEFAKNAQMMLSYIPAKDAIVYQVLAAISGAVENNRAYYGPSSAHNALRLNKGIWLLEEETDMTQPKSDPNKAQFNFPSRPDLNRQRDGKNPLTGK